MRKEGKSSRKGRRTMLLASLLLEESSLVTHTIQLPRSVDTVAHQGLGVTQTISAHPPPSEFQWTSNPPHFSWFGYRSHKAEFLIHGHMQHSEPASKGFKSPWGKLGRPGTSANSHNHPEDQVRISHL